MSAYTCTITFTDAAQTAVEITYTPALTPPKPFQFQLGDTITFTSNQAPWRVGYPNSPFEPNGGPVEIKGASGNSTTMTVRQAGRQQFICGLLKGQDYVGYGTGGGDLPPFGH